MANGGMQLLQLFKVHKWPLGVSCAASCWITLCNPDPGLSVTLLTLNQPLDCQIVTASAMRRQVGESAVVQESQSQTQDTTSDTNWLQHWLL